MNTQQEQLKALETLYSLFCEARGIFSGRRTLIAPDELPAIRRPVARGVALRGLIDNAWTRLFSTGYDVPSEWSAVDPVGKIITKRTADDPGITVRFTCTNGRAVDSVLLSMANAILKLKTQTPHRKPVNKGKRKDSTLLIQELIDKGKTDNEIAEQIPSATANSIRGVRKRYKQEVSKGKKRVTRVTRHA